MRAPPECPSSPPHTPLPLHTTPRSAYYYVHKETEATVWELEAGELARVRAEAAAAGTPMRDGNAAPAVTPAAYMAVWSEAHRCGAGAPPPPPPPPPAAAGPHSLAPRLPDRPLSSPPLLAALTTSSTSRRRRLLGSSTPRRWRACAPRPRPPASRHCHDPPLTLDATTYFPISWTAAALTAVDALTTDMFSFYSLQVQPGLRSFLFLGPWVGVCGSVFQLSPSFFHFHLGSRVSA